MAYLDNHPHDMCGSRVPMYVHHDGDWRVPGEMGVKNCHRRPYYPSPETGYCIRQNGPTWRRLNVHLDHNPKVGRLVYAGLASPLPPSQQRCPTTGGLAPRRPSGRRPRDPPPPGAKPVAVHRLEPDIDPLQAFCGTYACTPGEPARKCYLKQARHLHPDKHMDERDLWTVKFQKFQAQYDALADNAMCPTAAPAAYYPY